MTSVPPDLPQLQQGDEALQQPHPSPLVPLYPWSPVSPDPPQLHKVDEALQQPYPDPLTPPVPLQPLYLRTDPNCRRWMRPYSNLIPTP